MMENYINPYLTQIYIAVALITIGYVFGRIAERNHFRSINRRERKLVKLITVNSKRPLGDIGPVIRCELATGSAVISVDYFKRFVSSLRQLFGGNIRAYETLVDRARREAILRLKEAHPRATQLINLRIETSSIYKGQGNQVGSVEVLAYATAVYTES